MLFDGAQPQRRGGNAFGMSHLVVRVLRVLSQCLAAWWITPQLGSRPDTVVIGTLKRPRLAITIRATVVRAETTPTPHARVPRAPGRPSPQPLLPPLLAAPGAVARRCRGDRAADRL